MFILLAGETRRHPYVEVVERLFNEVVTGRDLLVQNFVQVLNGLGDIRLSTKTVHARLIAFVERDGRHGVLRVLEPQAHPLICDIKLAIQVLHEADVDLVAPVEDVRIGLCDRERGNHGLGDEFAILGIGARVMNVAAIVLLAAHPSVVVEVDVVRRIAIDHGSTFVTEKASEDGRVGRASADEAVLTERDEIADFSSRLLDLLQFLFLVEVVVFRFEVFRPCGREVCVAESNVSQEIEVKRLQLLEIPFSGVLVETEVQLLLFLDIKIHVHDWDGLVS